MSFWTKDGEVGNSQVLKKIKHFVNTFLPGHLQTAGHRRDPRKQIFAWVLPVHHTLFTCAKAPYLKQIFLSDSVGRKGEGSKLFLSILGFNCFFIRNNLTHTPARDWATISLSKST